MNNTLTSGALTSGPVTSCERRGFPGVNYQEQESPQSENRLPPTLSHLHGGVGLYAQGKTCEALWDFFLSVGSEPENPLGHYLCGLAFKALGLKEEAQAEWETTLALADRGEAPPTQETQWAGSMARRLLGKSEVMPC